MSFAVKIDQFEGPLDLMIHLIKENKLDLFDLDMNVLCDEYLAYLHAMESMHLEIASEYLSELAGLLEYKSKKMLPKEKLVIDEEYEEDQRDQLVHRLLEYQKYKEASQWLMNQYEERQKQYSKPMSQEAIRYTLQERTEPLQENPYELIKAMNRVLKRQATSMPQETKVIVRELSVEERDRQLKERFEQIDGRISFEELCHDCHRLQEVIVSFLSILDLIRQGFLTFVEEDNMIYLLKGADA